MTFNEAKDIFLNRGYVKVEGGQIFDGDKWRQCIVVISEWIKQEPCDDAISRQAVLEIFGYVMDYWREHAIDVEPYEIKDALIEQYEFTAKELSELPPVTPQPKYEDIVKAFQLGLGFGQKHDEMDKVIDEIKKVITPQQKIGHWIKEKSMYYDWDGYSYYCSECGRVVHKDEFEDMQIDYPYCHCGAKMEVEE